MTARPDNCPNCGHSVRSHTGTYCHDCGEPLVAERRKIRPNDGLEYLTPDELAECVSGISQPTYLRLWEILMELEDEGKQAPVGGDHHDPHGEDGYPTVEDPYSRRDVVMSGQGNVTSVWNRLSREQQLEINAAMEARDAEWDAR